MTRMLPQLLILQWSAKQAWVKNKGFFFFRKQIYQLNMKHETILLFSETLWDETYPSFLASACCLKKVTQQGIILLSPVFFILTSVKVNIILKLIMKAQSPQTINDHFIYLHPTPPTIRTSFEPQWAIALSVTETEETFHYNNWKLFGGVLFDPIQLMKKKIGVVLRRWGSHNQGGDFGLGPTHQAQTIN